MLAVPGKMLAISGCDMRKEDIPVLYRMFRHQRIEKKKKHT